MEKKRLKVVLVDDHAMIRDGIAAMLEREYACVVVAEAENGIDAARLISESDADLAIMDLGLPGKNGMDVLDDIRARGVMMPVIIFTMNKNPETFKRIERFKAQGFLLKDDAREHLLRAVAAILSGGRYYSPEIEAVMMCAGGIKNEECDPRVILTRQEYLVFVRIVQGRSTKQIAEERAVAVRTIEFHRRNINKKLKTNRVQDLVRIAQDFGLV